MLFEEPIDDLLFILMMEDERDESLSRSESREKIRGSQGEESGFVRQDHVDSECDNTGGLLEYDAINRRLRLWPDSCEWTEEENPQADIQSVLPRRGTQGC